MQLRRQSRVAASRYPPSRLRPEMYCAMCFFHPGRPIRSSWKPSEHLQRHLLKRFRATAAHLLLILPDSSTVNWNLYMVRAVIS